MPLCMFSAECHAVLCDTLVSEHTSVRSLRAEMHRAPQTPRQDDEWGTSRGIISKEEEADPG